MEQETEGFLGFREHEKLHEQRDRALKAAIIISLYYQFLNKLKIT